MKSRIALSAMLLGSFVLGVASVHPAALAMQIFGITACTASTACVGGSNGGSGAGVSGKSTGGFGVSGTSAQSSGVMGKTTNKSGFSAGVYGSDTTSGVHNYGVEGNSTNGTGIEGGSSNGDGVIAATSALKGSSAAIYLSALIGADLLVGAGANNSMFKIDSDGNIHTEGLLYSGGGCSAGCARERRERSYGTTAAVPTIEDTGEAQLNAGIARVPLDPAFANAIDPHEGYLVLLTPEGDTRGLYVTQRTSTGFIVRETLNGRSTIAFAYRIVAHPFGVHEARLPFVEMRPAGTACRPAMSLSPMNPCG